MKTNSEIFHQVFQYTSGAPFSSIYPNIGFTGAEPVEGGFSSYDEVQLWHPSIPQEEAVIVTKDNSEAFILRYPDNTYHILDVCGQEEYEGKEYVSITSVDEDDQSLVYLKDILDPEGMFWAYGLIIEDEDKKIAGMIEDEEFSSLVESLPSE